jgi:hypothetical protein
MKEVECLECSLLESYNFTPERLREVMNILSDLPTQPRGLDRYHTMCEPQHTMAV